MKARTQQDFPKKWVGIVKIVTGDNVAKLTSVETTANGKTKLFPNDSDSIKLALSEFPKIALRVVKPNDKAGKTFRVRLNEDADAVEAVTPVSGSFKAKLVELGPHKKDQRAVPFVKTFSKDGKDNSHLEFWSSYQITDGAFKGVILPALCLHYKFEQDENEEGLTQFDTVDTPQASQLHKLQEWAVVHGDILDEPIVWNTDDLDGVDNAVIEAYAEKHKCDFANVLPELESRALDKDRDVMIIMEKGYPKLIQAIENYGEDEESDDIDEKFPAKEVEAVEVKPIKIKSVEKKSPKATDNDEDL